MALTVAAVLALLLSAAALANPVANENALRGDTGWNIAEPPLAAAAGYAQLSVAPGDTLHLRVSAPAGRYQVHVWRLGWYEGSGGRRMACVPRGVTPTCRRLCSPRHPHPTR